MRVSRTESSAFTNPSLHLRMFKLSNPWVAWAISHGAYQDMRSRRPHIRDTSDEESLAVARKMGIQVSYSLFDDYQEMGEDSL